MLTRSPSAPDDLSRRSQAQRRMRRTAAQRLFCSTNGCTTYLVPRPVGRHAACPICGLRRAASRGPLALDEPRRHGRTERAPRLTTADAGQRASHAMDDDLAAWGKVIVLETRGRDSGLTATGRRGLRRCRPTARSSSPPRTRDVTGPSTSSPSRAASCERDGRRRTSSRVAPLDESAAARRPSPRSS